MTQIKDILNFAKNRESSIPDNLHIGWITNEAGEIVISWVLKHEYPTVYIYNVFSKDKIQGFDDKTVSKKRLEDAVIEYLKTNDVKPFSLGAMLGFHNPLNDIN